MNPTPDHTPDNLGQNPSDDLLMLEIRRLWETLDPPPGDLADGVLATLAAIDLEFEFELLTLVESHDALAGARSLTSQMAEVGQWSLEFAGPDFRVLLRISTVNDRRRVDGWVLPRLPDAHPGRQRLRRPPVVRRRRGRRPRPVRAHQRLARPVAAVVPAPVE